MKGVSGSLLASDVLQQLAAGASSRERANAVRSIVTTALRSLGPASAARAVLDVLAEPLAGALDLRLTNQVIGGEIAGAIEERRSRVAVFAVGGWGTDLNRLTRLAATVDERGPRWSIAINGATLRISDRARAYSRRAVDFDLVAIEESDEAVASLVGLLGSVEGTRLDALEQAVTDSDRHRAAVGESLQTGVEDALALLVAAFVSKRRGRLPGLDAALANALTIVFRILFLLFAEARGLVPQWHPIYRTGYTIESLRARIERNRQPPGVWQAILAISRLAHRGCRAGTLRVMPFNGRLFAPASAPLAESIAIDDRRIRDVLLAITTRAARDRRERISYADLGVEQLGAVYERVLDFAPTVVDRAVVFSRTGRRKATGTFYTPRTFTEYLVRRTLAPLVRNRSAAALLDLKILDPAMGSGAFLVAACRYLADAYERALVRDGELAHDDLDASVRAGFRRTIALRCLYGVDRNPTAVQLARLSLWLATLAADRPLTFLDHHLRTGNSLVGAAPRDVMRQPPGTRGRRRRPDTPLFDTADLLDALAAVIHPRTRMAAQPDDTADIVRGKERSLAAIEANGPLRAWRALADGWCAAWFQSTPMNARLWGAIMAALRGGASSLPPEIERGLLDDLRGIAERERFFHWELEFPEVFFDAGGAPLGVGGFDAVLGNPPWDTLRSAQDDAHDDLGPRLLTRFTRDSGCYRLQSGGHANLYQVFTERALQLLKPDGRFGLLLPSGLFSDHGCVRLRRELLERCAIDGVLSFDNREGLFPIHRGVRFVLLTGLTGRSLTDVPAVFGLHSPATLEDIPDQGPIPVGMMLPVPLIRKFSGDSLAIPELRGERDRRLLAAILSSSPRLGSADGWNCRFGRELNATDDRRHFGTRGLPVLEGKLIEPFRVNVERASARIMRTTAQRVLGSRAAFDRPRLGYREVAGSTNRLTLIAAMIPAAAVTTHTIFCLKEQIDLDGQWFLCGMFNSFVANYLVRLHGGTHVTASILASLPMPAPGRDSRAFVRIAALARALSTTREGEAAYVELQALAAWLYGCDAADFAHVLDTFPLVERRASHACLAAFEKLESDGTSC